MSESITPTIGKACAEKEREGFPKAGKFWRLVVLLNLQELINSRHQVSAQSVHGHKRMLVSTVGCVTGGHGLLHADKDCRIMCASVEINDFGGLSQQPL